VRLDGLALDGSSGGGVNQLVAAFAGGDTQQDGLAAVASTVTVTGGEAPYAYAATLLDPRGVDRSAILTGGTTASPGFTPDLTGGGGVWTLRTTVTDAGGRTAVATKAVTVGQSGFVLARSIVSDETTDATVSGGNIAWGGVTFAAPNAGVEVVDGDLVLANAVGSTQFNTSTRTPPLVTVSLSTLAGLSAVGTRQVLIVLDVESYAPSTANEALRFGIENATNQIGTGASSRGVIGGQVFSTNIRVGEILCQDTSGIGQQAATATAASIAGIACLVSGTTVEVYSSTTAFADASAVFDTTVKQNGGMRAGATVNTLNQVIIAAAKPSAGAGAVCTIRGLQVWVR
jgi:hypothetical protein